ncbi:sensor domain-containing diguanylate cyclase [bacterium]|nr:sensor domain-containing diguanylate cyclase [bacterium]
MKNFNNQYIENLLNNIHDGLFITDVHKKISFWNKGAENITGFKESEMKGKPCSTSFLCPIDEKGTFLCQENCPAQQALTDENIHQTKAYFHHKEGFRIPVSLRAIPLLNKKEHLIGIACDFVDISPKVLMPQKTRELKRMELIDPLTQVGNRRYMEMQLHSRLNEKKWYNLPFGTIFVDLDHMEKINETYGQKVGDRILRMISQTLSKNIRFFDTIGRWEGEKFLVVILNVDEPILDFVANKLRLLVEESNILVNATFVGTTISLGATLARVTDSPEKLVKRAESLMYHSKWMGRNRVSLKLEKEESEY